MVFQKFPSLEDRLLYPVDPSVQDQVCNAELILGVASKNCVGNGICSLYIKGTLRRERAFCHFSEVKITTDSSQQLLFAFDKKTIRKSTIKKYFTRPAFIMEEDFVIPNFVKEQLSISRSLIASGAYLMYEFGGCYHVFFPHYE